MNYTAYIIDDEKESRDALRMTIERFAKQIEITGEADTVEDGVKLLMGKKPDILFLDIQIGDLTGFDLLDLLKEIDFRIIFVTAYDEYAIKAFQYSALDYIMKPVSPMSIMQAIQKFEAEKERYIFFQEQIDTLKSNLHGNVKKIAVPTSEGVKFLKIEEIIHLQSDSCYTKFFLTNNRTLIVTRTLKEYVSILPPDQFFRIHKSHFICLGCVEEYINRDGGYVLMENGNKLPIARSKKNELLEVLTQ